MMMGTGHHYKELCVCYFGYSEQGLLESEYLCYVHFADKRLRSCEAKRFRK